MATKKRKKKGGLLEKIGIKAKPAPTEQDVKRQERYDTYKEIWKYLRFQIDAGVRHYFQTGSLDQLEPYVINPALAALSEQLEQLRSAGVVVVHPDDRAERSKPRLRVISEQLSSSNKPERFVVEERFLDFAELRTMGGQTKQAEGKERVIHATIDVQGPQEFAVASLLRLDDATLDD